MIFVKYHIHRSIPQNSLYWQQIFRKTPKATYLYSVSK